MVFELRALDLLLALCEVFRGKSGGGLCPLSTPGDTSEPGSRRGQSVPSRLGGTETVLAACVARRPGPLWKHCIHTIKKALHVTATLPLRAWSRNR